MHFLLKNQDGFPECFCGYTPPRMLHWWDGKVNSRTWFLAADDVEDHCRKEA